MDLTSTDLEMLSGARADGPRIAMQMIVRAGEMYGAERLINISWAHVASAYDNGQANVDFASRLVESGTKVAVPTTLTACSIDLRRHSLSNDDASTARALHLIKLYKAMGCDAVMTCAPYHTRSEPGFGEHIAWCESSAVVYANSILGARTNRYVEFLDMCAAITGRVPDCGLHRTKNRRATVLFRIMDVPDSWLAGDWFYHVLGIVLGRRCGDAIPAIDGLPLTTDKEQLRALGTAAATVGSLSMFHAIGITPEAPTIEQAFHDDRPAQVQDVTAEEIRATAISLSRNAGEPLTAVCLGSPHFSLTEFRQLATLIAGRRIAKEILFHVSTSQTVLTKLKEEGLLADLQSIGVHIVTDRCTYYRPTVAGCDGHVMTNSAKWAYYAPGTLSVPVTFGNLQACVDSACAGSITDSEWN